MDNLDEFFADREKALLSMDKETIMAYIRKYDMKSPEDEEIFWGGVHMARTALASLPMFERAASKRWLIANGFTPLDDGDVLPPIKRGEMKKYYERCKEFGV